MAKFPEYDSIPIQPTVRMRIRTKTLISRFEGMGEENRKQKWLYPKRDIVIGYKSISKANAETLWEFYLARMGQYSAFNFFVPEPELTYPSYTGEYVGTGDGTNEVFNLPCRISVGRQVYLDSAELTEGVNYNFTSGGGADGADKIDFSDSDMVPPSDGAVLTMDFTGGLKIRSVFDEEYLDLDMFWDKLVTINVKLRGLLNE